MTTLPSPSITGFPRVSGDEPSAADAYKQLGGFSPRERG